MLQALAARRLLPSFDYLSTVSGGGYIGGWLTTWAHRHPGGIAGVMEDLVPRADRAFHEAAPIAHLRRYSNYLTPHGRLNPAYPHESTTDQWFSESQFESYRALGEYIMTSVAEKAGGQLGRKLETVDHLFEGVKEYLTTRPEAAPVTSTKSQPDGLRVS